MPPSVRRSRPAILKDALTREIDASPLVFFRVLFGLLMVVEVIRYWAYGRIGRYYIEPTFFFGFFDGITPVGGAMYVVFASMGAAAFCLAVGYRYRLASALFFLLYTYAFLLDKAQYNNHYYLICLLGFLFLMTDGHRGFSIDAVRRGLPCRVPAWQVYVFRFQICVVFFYAGVAKINADWLAGEPARAWLASRSDYFLIGPLLLQEWFVYLYAYGGMLFDLLIGFLLLWSPTRVFGFVLLLGFNVLNLWFYDIGIFPYLTMSSFVLFMSAPAIRGLFDRWERTRALGTAMILDLLGTSTGSGRDDGDRRTNPVLTRGLAFLMSVFVALQLLVPLRHFAIPGHVGWTEEGHMLSWRMKLRDKDAREIAFYTRDRRTGRIVDLPTEELTRRQRRKMSTRPHMILQYAGHLSEGLRARGIQDAPVHVRTSVSLNGRDPRPLIDESVDLAGERYRLFRHNEWITSLDQE